MTPERSDAARTVLGRGTVATLAAGLAITQLLADAPQTTARTTDQASSQPLHGKATTLPDRIAVRSDVRQMVTVTSKRFGSTTGTLNRWRRPVAGDWTRVGRPVHVRIGYNGWVRAERRVQSTGTTPAGKFTMPYAFGRRADPGAHLRYRHVDGNDYWPYDRRDPATYNVYQEHKAKRTHWRSRYVERLDSYKRQYGYAIVVGFNLPKGIYYSTDRRQWVARERADKRAGGGIFLHVHGDGLTAGCVSMARSDMRRLLRWVRPGANPRVVMGPRSYVVGL